MDGQAKAAVEPKIDFQQWDRRFEDWMKEEHIPGGVYAIFTTKGVTHILNYGKSSLEKDTPVTDRTQFRIASMTKSFTSLAALMLRERGQLSLDDPVEKHIPEFAKAIASTNLFTDSPTIRVRNLMSMTAGFPTDDPWCDRRMCDSKDEFQALLAKGLTFSRPPGVEFEYSNLSYGILGQIIDKVTGMRYQDFITQEIFKPLGMNDTVWEYKDQENLSSCYRWRTDNWNIEEPVHDGVFGAMAGIITTAHDLAKYAALHLQAWPPRNGEDNMFVKRAVLREMHTPKEFIGQFYTYRIPGIGSKPHMASYSYGLRCHEDVNWNKGGRLVWIRHSGGLPGWGSDWRFLPEHGFGILAFGNRTYTPIGRFCDELMYTVVTKNPDYFPVRTLAVSSILSQRCNQLYEMLSSSDWSKFDLPSIFASNFFLDFSLEERVFDLLLALSDQGEIVEGQVLVITPESNTQGAFILKCSQGQLKVTMSMSPENPPLIQEVIYNAY